MQSGLGGPFSSLLLLPAPSPRLDEERGSDRASQDPSLGSPSQPVSTWETDASGIQVVARGQRRSPSPHARGAAHLQPWGQLRPAGAHNVFWGLHRRLSQSTLSAALQGAVAAAGTQRHGRGSRDGLQRRWSPWPRASVFGAKLLMASLLQSGGVWGVSKIPRPDPQNPAEPGGTRQHVSLCFCLYPARTPRPRRGS